MHPVVQALVVALSSEKKYSVCPCGSVSIVADCPPTVAEVVATIPAPGSAAVVSTGVELAAGGVDPPPEP